MFPSFLTSATLFCAFQRVVAQSMTSLYVPGFTAQPLSADVLGVDVEGRTTWGLQGGAAQTIGRKLGFLGTATLVEGPGFASITYADPSGVFTIDKSCTLSVGLAFCGTSTGSESAIAVETPIFLPVQVGTAVAALITTLPTPQPTTRDTTPTGEIPPARTSPSQRQVPLSYFGATLCVWLILAWPMLM